MDKKALKKSLSITSNILLVVTLILMLLSVWKEYFYLSIFTISLSIVSIIITIFSAEEYTFKSMFKELNIYFFVVSIIEALSVVVNSKVLFYIGLALFILMILLYLIPLFVKEKEENVENNNTSKNQTNKKSKPKKKKKKK